MKAMIICESWFGNAYAVAELISNGLAEHEVNATVVRVQDAPDVVGVDYELLILGAPTHSGGMSTPESRKDAVNDGGDANDSSMRDWIEGVTIADGVRVAAFTTLVDDSNPDHSAATEIAKRLSERFPGLAVEINRFVVEESHGPLAYGEDKSATNWGKALAATLP